MDAPDVESLHSGYSPSIDPGATLTDVGGVSSNLDDATALSQAFIDGHKPFMSKMPWENPIMEPIFWRSRYSAVYGNAVEVAQPAPAAEQLEKIRKRATDVSELP